MIYWVFHLQFYFQLLIHWVAVAWIRMYLLKIRNYSLFLWVLVYFYAILSGINPFAYLYSLLNSWNWAGIKNSIKPLIFERNFNDFNFSALLNLRNTLQGKEIFFFQNFISAKDAHKRPHVFSKTSSSSQLPSPLHFIKRKLHKIVNKTTTKKQPVSIKSRNTILTSHFRTDCIMTWRECLHIHSSVKILMWYYV